MPCGCHSKRRPPRNPGPEGRRRTPSGSLQVRSSSILGRQRAFFFTPSPLMASKGKVRRHLLQFGAFLLLLVCLCGHVAETFDFWDHTLQTGSDIEYSLVIVVLIAGAGFGLTHVAAVAMRTVSLLSCLLSSLGASCSWAPPPVASTGYSPPQPLRI
jgi:hypothetical protein